MGSSGGYIHTMDTGNLQTMRLIALPHGFKYGSLFTVSKTSQSSHSTSHVSAHSLPITTTTACDQKNNLTSANQALILPQPNMAKPNFRNRGPEDPRWRGPQKYFFTVLSIKNIIFIIYTIFTVVEISLFRRWSNEEYAGPLLPTFPMHT